VAARRHLTNSITSTFTTSGSVSKVTHGQLNTAHDSLTWRRELHLKSSEEYKFLRVSLLPRGFVLIFLSGLTGGFFF